MRETFDVVILGGGNAGIGVTGPVRRAGLSVAMIEPLDLGGTCPNRGCTPKKVLVAAGQALHDIERAAAHHIAVGKPRLDWAALIDREKNIIKDIPANLARAMAASRGRSDQGIWCLCCAQHHPRRRSHARGQTRRCRDGLEAAAATDPRRRAHDHVGRDVERSRLAGFGYFYRGRRNLTGIRSHLRARRRRSDDSRGADAVPAGNGRRCCRPTGGGERTDRHHNPDRRERAAGSNGPAAGSGWSLPKTGSSGRPRPVVSSTVPAGWPTPTPWTLRPVRSNMQTDKSRSTATCVRPQILGFMSAAMPYRWLAATFACCDL